MIQYLCKKVRNKKGFTLIELIVVIAILGILAGIAVPRFSQVSGDAQEKADEATARTILSAVTMAEAKSAPDEPTEEDINEFLNEDITLVTTEPGTGSGWTAWLNAGVWEIHKDGVRILPKPE